MAGGDARGSIFVELPNPNFARTDPANANRGDCAGRYAAGQFNAKVEWALLRVAVDSLRVTEAGAADIHLTKGGASAPLGFAKTTGCAGGGIANSEIVIDLIGTPFKVAGQSSCKTTMPVGLLDAMLTMDLKGLRCQDDRAVYEQQPKMCDPLRR